MKSDVELAIAVVCNIFVTFGNITKGTDKTIRRDYTVRFPFRGYITAPFEVPVLE